MFCSTVEREGAGRDELSANATDELKPDPDGVGVTGLIRSGIECVVEVEFRVSQIVVANERHWPSDHSLNRTLVFLRQVVHKAGWQRVENDLLTWVRPVVITAHLRHENCSASRRPHAGRAAS